MNVKTSAVTLDARGISIRGRREVILCASLFYFRVPEGSWEDRMRKIRLAGYDCIDVYFPWNFHETEKDAWDFSTGMKDVERFLGLAEANDLFVMARPGPYICSEWDGGSLPAYLFAEELDIRQNDPAYLARVEEWYRRILPIIARHQIDVGGSVVLLQIENELDFFSCRDVPGYMGALAESALGHGITVPVIACAGQADIYGAWGGVPGVSPSMNLYLDSKMPGLEDGVTVYTEILAGLDTPLMVTEMGRDNLLMRRFLASGAKLLGPYNQVSGFDFGFTNSVNNWGDPVSFLPSHYDFRSLITPYGEIRDFIAADRVLSGFLDSMGESFAGAVPLGHGEENGYTLHVPTGETGRPPVLRLAGRDGGEAVAVNNVSDDRGDFVLTGRGFERTVTLPPGTSTFVLVNVDLSPMGLPATVDISTAEPVYLDRGFMPVIIWQAPVAGTVEMTVGGRKVSFNIDAAEESRLEVELPDGRTLTMAGIGREAAAEVTGFRDGKLLILEDGSLSGPSEKPGIEVEYTMAPAGNVGLFSSAEEIEPSEGNMQLEKNGVLRGYGLYTAEPVIDRPTAVVIHDAADVVSLYRGGEHITTAYPAGGHALIPLGNERPKGSGGYEVRAEIWGHSNFDDSRKPSIRISSLRGMSGFTEVREIRPLPWWRTESPAGGSIPYYMRFGGHLTTRRPARSVWRSTVPIPADDDSILLNFDGIACEAEIEIDSVRAGAVDQFTQIVDISGFVVPGRDIDLTVRLSKRHYEEAAGRVSVILGRKVTGWRLRGAAEATLNADSERVRPGSEPVKLPVSLPPGQLAWLYMSQKSSGRFADQKIRITGKNCKLTVFYNGVVCGRIFLPTEGGPSIRGGGFDLAYLPGCWSLEGNNRISLLAEAVGPDEAEIEKIEFLGVE